LLGWLTFVIFLIEDKKHLNKRNADMEYQSNAGKLHAAWLLLDPTDNQRSSVSRLDSAEKQIHGEKHLLSWTLPNRVDSDEPPT